MKIRKIMLTKVNTLQVVYKDADNNVVTLDGVNIVHKDLKVSIHTPTKGVTAYSANS